MRCGGAALRHAAALAATALQPNSSHTSVSCLLGCGARNILAGPDTASRQLHLPSDAEEALLRIGPQPRVPAWAPRRTPPPGPQRPRRDAAMAATAEAMQSTAALAAGLPAVVCYHHPCIDGVFAALAAHNHYTRLRDAAAPGSAPGAAAGPCGGRPPPVRFKPLTVFKEHAIDDLGLTGNEVVYLLDYAGPRGFARRVAAAAKRCVGPARGARRPSGGPPGRPASGRGLGAWGLPGWPRPHLRTASEFVPPSRRRRRPFCRRLLQGRGAGPPQNRLRAARGGAARGRAQRQHAGPAAAAGTQRRRGGSGRGQKRGRRWLRRRRGGGPAARQPGCAAGHEAQWRDAGAGLLWPGGLLRRHAARIWVRRASPLGGWGVGVGRAGAAVSSLGEEGGGRGELECRGRRGMKVWQRPAALATDARLAARRRGPTAAQPSPPPPSRAPPAAPEPGASTPHPRPAPRRAAGTSRTPTCGRGSWRAAGSSTPALARWAWSWTPTQTPPFLTSCARSTWTAWWARWGRAQPPPRVGSGGRGGVGGGVGGTLNQARGRPPSLLAGSAAAARLERGEVEKVAPAAGAARAAPPLRVHPHPSHSSRPPLPAPAPAPAPAPPGHPLAGRGRAGGSVG
jgi:hypothetical protein